MQGMESKAEATNPYASEDVDRARKTVANAARGELATPGEWVTLIDAVLREREAVQNAGWHGEGRNGDR